MSDQRTTYETTWYDEPVTCCSWCSFVQFDGASTHAGWCDRDAVLSQSTASGEEA